MSMSLSVPEIFAIKVRSCPKSHQILDEKVYPRYHAYLAARRLEKFGEVDPHSPKVIGAHYAECWANLHHIFFSSNVGGIVVDQLLFRLSISSSAKV